MKKGIGLIAILLVPSVIYLLFSLGEHHTSRLGYYGTVAEITKTGDTIFDSFQFPALSDRTGQPVSYDDMIGQVTLVHTFDWPCDEACADHITTLNNYLNRVEHKDEWNLVSVCLNEITDEDLQSLAAKRIYSGDNWKYYRLATPKGKMALTELFEFNTNSQKNAAFVALLDQEQKIRGYFNIRTQQDNKRLQDAIKLLIQEPHISWKERK